VTGREVAGAVKRKVDGWLAKLGEPWSQTPVFDPGPDSVLDLKLFCRP
jgi:hypothetical protein